MVNKVIIRTFTIDDLQPVVSLLHRTIDTCYKQVYSQECIDRYKEYHCVDNIIKDSLEGYTIVLVNNNVIVGVGASVDNDIRRVYVDPNCQRSGFGCLIMENLENNIKQSGFNEADLASSTPSIDFYLRLGYEVLEETYIELENDRLHYYKMRKQL